QLGRRERKRYEVVNLYVPCGALDLNPCPRQLVQWLTIAFQSRIHRWNLLLAPAKLAQHLVQTCAVELRYSRRLDNGAFGIAGRRPCAQADRESVELLPGKDVACDLGRLSEADRQHAGRQRIEAAHVPRLIRLEQA